MLTPIPGRDYPRTWNEFLDWFATEEACQAFLEKLPLLHPWFHGRISLWPLHCVRNQLQIK